MVGQSHRICRVAVYTLIVGVKFEAVVMIRVIWLKVLGSDCRECCILLELEFVFMMVVPVVVINVGPCKIFVFHAVIYE